LGRFDAWLSKLKIFDARYGRQIHLHPLTLREVLCEIAPLLLGGLLGLETEHPDATPR
jgi:hypothetical protein